MTRWIWAAVLALLAPACVAGYAYPTPPVGWGGSSGAWTYGGTAAANAPWVNGSAAAQVTVNVGGRPVTVPATMRLASNAGQFIARNGLITQAIGRTVPFIAWALAAGWVWDQASQLWRVPITGTYWQACNASGNCGAVLATPGEACASLYPQYGGGAVNVGTAASPQWRCTNSGGASLGNQGVVSPQPPPSGSTRVATNSDADSLGGTPMPAALPGVADDVVGLPVQDPEISPWVVPVGDPVAIPYSDPAAWQQPVISVVPSPEPAHPWRVDLQPGSVVSNSPVGLPGAGEEADPAEEPVPDEAPSMCEEFPEASACQPLGSPEDAGTIPTVNVPLSFESPVSFGPSNAACPAARVLPTALAGNLEFSYEGACMYADGIRPVVIALAYLASVLAFFGIGSRD